MPYVSECQVHESRYRIEDSCTPGNSNADGDQADPAAIDLVTVSTATARLDKDTYPDTLPIQF